MVEVKLNGETDRRRAVEEIPAQFSITVNLEGSTFIELPKTIECNHGKCPERATIAPYLHLNPKKGPISRLPT